MAARRRRPNRNAGPSPSRRTKKMPSPPNSLPDEPAPDRLAAWQRAEGGDAGWQLRLAGDWPGVSDGRRVAMPAPPDDLGPGPVAIEAAALSGWDARFAAALWQLLSTLRAGGVAVDLDGLPPGLQQIMSLSLVADDAPPPAPPV